MTDVVESEAERTLGDDEPVVHAMAADADRSVVKPGRHGWQLVFRTTRQQWLGLSWGVTAGLCWTVTKVAIPSLVQRAIDNGIGVTNKAGNLVGGDLDDLKRWTLIVLAVGTVSAMFVGFRRYSAFREARWAELSLRNRMFSHIQRLHFGFHDRTQAGELMSRTNTDLQQVQAFIVLIPLTIANLGTVVGVTIVLANIDLTLTALALGSLPLLNALAKRFSSRLYPSQVGIQAESAQLASVVEESVAGIRVVKGFGAEPIMNERLVAEADDIYEQAMISARIRAKFVPGLDLLPSVGQIAVLAYGGHAVLRGDLSIGELVAFNTYIAILIWPLRMLGNIIAQAQRAAAAGDRVHEVLETEPGIVDPTEPVPLPSRSLAKSFDRTYGRVVFEGVRFGYADGPDVLAGLDLVLEAGESVAVVGATGSGKTTVARLIPRFYDVRSGAVTIDGVDVRQIALGELRRSVGLVFEDTFLFSDTVRGNIAFANPDADDAAVKRAALLAGAAEFIEQMPGGYETEIGERGFSLSGGQRQRIAIARAILADPRVLILDDATSAVDPTKEHEIRDALGEVMGGRTTLVIAHRPATIALADRVVLLDQGVVAATGTHEQLLASSARYAEVLAAAAAREAEALAGPDEPEVEEVRA